MRDRKPYKNNDVSVRVTFIMFVVAVILALFTFVWFDKQAQASPYCGMKPMKPMPPMGCKDLVAVCSCESDGTNCEWRWNCVR